MATLIICPACATRYEVKAAFPPEGRKVRCSKCSHVWKATPVGAEAPPAPQAAAQPSPQAPAPQAAPQAPAPQPTAPQAPPPQAAPAQPPAQEPAPPPPPPEAAPPPHAEAAPGGLPQGNAEYPADVDVAAQVAQMNAEAMPPPPPEPEPAKQGGLFAKIMGKRAPAEPPALPPEVAPPPPQADATFTEAGPADASFDAGYSEEEQQEAALADPALVAAAFGEAPPKGPRKPLPIVAIGWGILALIVVIVVGLFAFAPSTTVSMLPGAARVYSLLGMPVGANGLAFEGVRYGWTSDGSQTVLEVQGNVRNTSSATMSVPTVVIALRDEKGEEISEWTTEVGTAELSAGEEAPFLRQIPSPPSNVRSLKVRFAKAN